MFDTSPMNPRSDLVALLALVLLGAAIALRDHAGLPRGLVLAVGAVSLLLTLASLVMWHREQSASAATRAISRRYLRAFFPALLGYVATVAASVALMPRVEPAALRALVALSPLLPIGFFLRATARYIRALDELQRRIELEALALGSVFLVFAYLTAGFLQAARLVELDAAKVLLAAFPALALVYGLAKRVVARHYA